MENIKKYLLFSYMFLTYYFLLLITRSETLGPWPHDLTQVLFNTTQSHLL